MQEKSLMQWIGRRESSNVEDRRGISGGGIAAGGGILGLIIYLLVSFLGDGSVDSNNLPEIPSINNSRNLSPEEQKQDEERAKFVKVVLADTEDIWGEIFRQNGKQYQAPVLVLFRDRVQSACGGASSASGPFYCPNDQKLYIDLSFYEDMQKKLNAPGDFAQAYVIAHEVGHHIQMLNGTAERVSRMRQQADERESNRLSVMMELQADFLAGVWAHYEQQKKKVVEEGDIAEALNAANAIGDDRLQKRSTGEVVPDAFTHGTSAQRVYWFKKGYETGDLKQGDTFNDPNL